MIIFDLICIFVRECDGKSLKKQKIFNPFFPLPEIFRQDASFVENGNKAARIE
jgi:hypothetical protein